MLRFSWFCSAHRFCGVYQPNHCLVWPGISYSYILNVLYDLDFRYFPFERVGQASSIEGCLPRLNFKRSTERPAPLYHKLLSYPGGSFFGFLTFFFNKGIYKFFGIFFADRTARTWFSLSFVHGVSKKGGQIYDFVTKKMLTFAILKPQKRTRDRSLFPKNNTIRRSRSSKTGRPTTQGGLL